MLLISPGEQPPPKYKEAAKQGGLAPVGQASSSFFSSGQMPPPPNYHQSFSSLPTPPRRRGSLLEEGAQLRHGSTGVSGGRDALVAAVARALPVTLTYAPYGFCLVSRFPFINSLRTPLSALFKQVGAKYTRRRHHLPCFPLTNMRYMYPFPHSPLRTSAWSTAPPPSAPSRTSSRLRYTRCVFISKLLCVRCVERGRHPQTAPTK